MKAPIKTGQIWYIKGEDDPNQWKEALLGKTRPHLVISITGNTALCAPLTHSEKQGTHNQIYKIMLSGVPNYVVLNQIKAVSQEDFLTYKTSVSNLTLETIKSKITTILLDEKKPRINNSRRTSAPISEDTKKQILSDYQFMPMKELQRRYKLSKRAIYSLIWGGGQIARA